MKATFVAWLPLEKCVLKFSEKHRIVPRVRPGRATGALEYGQMLHTGLEMELFTRRERHDRDGLIGGAARQDKARAFLARLRFGGPLRRRPGNHFKSGAPRARSKCTLRVGAPG